MADAEDRTSKDLTSQRRRMLATASGLEVQHVWSVRPGAYGRREPDLDREELLLVARRPSTLEQPEPPVVP